MIRALVAEISKLKRASLPLWTAAAVLVAPALSNVFAVAQDSGQLDMSWPEFFALAPMTMGTWWGILVFGLVTADLFGREYAQGIAPTMLTAPTRREYFVVAKFVVLVVWVFSLAAFSLVSQALAASLLGLEGFAWAEVWTVAGDVFTVALLIFLTLPVIALVAVASRGIFAPMILSGFGFSLGMIGGIAGWGSWLPWAMPTAVGGTLFGPVMQGRLPELTEGSWAIAIGMFVLGVAAVIHWVNCADSRG